MHSSKYKVRYRVRSGKYNSLIAERTITVWEIGVEAAKVEARRVALRNDDDLRAGGTMEIVDVKDVTPLMI